MAKSFVPHGVIQTNGVASSNLPIFNVFSGIRVQGPGFNQGPGSKFKVQSSRFKVQGLGLRAQDSGF